MILFKKYKNKKWRKEAKVDDKCYFINVFNTKTWGWIDRIENEKVLFKTKNLDSSSSQWIDIGELNAL